MIPLEDIPTVALQFATPGAPPGQEVVLQERLAQDRLDFSLESLKVVDDYLEDLRTLGEEALFRHPRFTATMGRAGAYVGEVLIKAAPDKFQWISFEEAGESGAPGISPDEPELWWFLTLRQQETKLTWPINKVLKRIANGDEDSIYGYGRWILNDAEN